VTTGNVFSTKPHYGCSGLVEEYRTYHMFDTYPRTRRIATNLEKVGNL